MLARTRADERAALQLALSTAPVSVGGRVRKRSQAKRKRRVGRPPGQPTEKTRRAILVAARSCFVRLGFERATNKDIAAAAGLTAAALYRHFPSKSDLYIAVVRDATLDMLPRLERSAASNPGAKTVLRTMLEMYGSMNEREHSAVLFLGSLPSEMQRHPQIAKQMLTDPGKIFTLINDGVAASVRAGELAQEKAPRVVAMTVATLMGVSAYATTLGPGFGREAIAGFLDLLDHTLFLPDAAGE